MQAASCKQVMQACMLGSMQSYKYTMSLRPEFLSIPLVKKSNVVIVVVGPCSHDHNHDNNAG